MSETPSTDQPTPENAAPLGEEQPTTDAAPAQPVAEFAPVEQAPVAPTAAPAAPVAPVAPVAPAATQPTEPLPPTFAAPAASAAPAGPAAPVAEKKQRSVAVPVIAAAVVAALLGGGAGAGVAAWAITSQSTEQSPGSASPQTINVNNPDGTDLVTAVAAKAAPSVVTISVSASTAGGTGSGVILSDDGYVLTNTHVVTLDGETADGTIEVTTADGRIYTATIVGLDPVVDLAVLKLDDASGLTPIEWADSDAVEVGDQVIAIGAPLGLSNTVTDGIVSAVDRSIQIASSAVPDSGDSDQTPDQDQNGGQGPFDFWNFDQGEGGSGQQQPSSSSAAISLPVIQTDAAINPGNSGGALVNDRGQLVGINVAIASTGSSGSSQSGSIGVGFSIPSSLAQRVADEIIADGEATHGLLGASVTTATSADSDVVGSVIKEVTADGAAAKAGLEAGDVVTVFDGHAITSSTDLTAQVRALAAGAKAELTYLRDGKESTVTVTLGQLNL